MARSETNLRSMIANGSDPKSLPWYESDLEEVPEPAKTLLAEYSKIPSDQVVQHVNSMVRCCCFICTRIVFTDPIDV